jgi:hypothetical protein
MDGRIKEEGSQFIFVFPPSNYQLSWEGQVQEMVGNTGLRYSNCPAACTCPAWQIVLKRVGSDLSASKWRDG